MSDDAVEAITPAVRIPRWRRVRAGWRERPRWLRRLVLAIAVLLVLQPLVGFLIVPWVVRSFVVPRIARSLDGDLRVAAVSFNPYTWRLGLDRIVLADPDGRDAAGADRIEVDFNPLSSLVLPGWRFNEILFDAPFVDALYAPTLGLNLARALGTGSESGSTERPAHFPRLVIGAIGFRSARGTIGDRSFEPPIVATFRDLSGRIDAIDTSTGFDDVNALVATLDDGSTITWAGTLSLDPPSSMGTLVLDHIGIDRYAGHAVRYTDLALRGGRLSAVLSYRFEPIATPPVLQVTLASASVEGFAADREGAGFISLPSLELGRSEADAVARRASISRLAIDGGSLLLDRDDHGDFNVARMIRTPTDGPPPRPSADRAERVDVTTLQSAAQQLVTSLSYIVEDLTGDWTISLADLSIRRQALDFVDRSVAREVRVEVRDLDLTAGPISSEAGFVLPYSLTARVNGAASSAEGSFAVHTRILDTELATDSIGLAAFGPYLRLVEVEPLASSDVAGGTATLRGHFRFETPEPPAIDWTWKGDVRLDGLEMVHATDRTPILASEHFDIAGDLATSTRIRGDRPGAVGRWEGRFGGAGARLGAPLVDAIGLGRGELSAADLAFDGSFDVDLPVGGDAVGHFVGEIATRTVAGSELGSDRNLAATGESISVKAAVTLRLPAVGGATAEWSGSIDAKDLNTSLAGDRPIAAELSAFSLKGDGNLGLSSDAALHLAWDGDAMVVGVGARASADGLEGKVADARLAGKLSLARDGTTPLAIDFRGQAAVGAADFTRAETEGRLEVSESSLRFDGSAAARLEGEGALRLAVEGSVDLAAPEGSLEGEASGLASAESVLLHGKVEGMLRHASREATLEGVVVLRDYRAAEDDGSDEDNEAYGLAITLEGKATLASEGAATRLAWTGSAKSDGGAIELRSLSEPASLSYEQAAAEGTLKVDAANGRATIAWSGSQDVRDLEASLSASESSASLGRLGGAGEVSATLEGERITATWTGNLAAESIALADAANDRSAESASATIEGAATLERSGIGEATIAFDGSVALGESAAALGSEPDTAHVAGRALDYRGQLSLMNRGGVPSAAARGDLRIDAPSVMVGDPPRTTVEVALIEVSGLDFDQARDAFGADVVLLRGANLEQRLGTGEPATEGEAAPTPEELLASLPFALRIGELRMEESSLAFLAPPGEEPERFEIDQVTLGARGIASDGATESTIELAGRVGGSGRLGASGTIDLFRTPMVADLTITIDDALLPPANSISARHVGWRLAAGRLTTRIPTVMRDGRIQGELRFTLDGVELAGRSRHPGAPDLPLDFALAVLKDANGQVKGTIPFSGDLADPKFSLGGLIGEVILGFIGKIATAPFQLLLSAFAAGEEVDLSQVPFAAGSATLESDALKRVDLLVRALRDRPGLRIGVQGHVATDPDARALRLVLLREVVAERARKGFPPRRSVDDALYRKLVGELWRETPDGLAARKARRTATFEEMENDLLATMPLTDALLEDLAARRAEAVAAALRGAGVSPAQFVVEAPPPDGLARPEPVVSIDLELGG